MSIDKLPRFFFTLLFAFSTAFGPERAQAGGRAPVRDLVEIGVRAASSPQMLEHLIRKSGGSAEATKTILDDLQKRTKGLRLPRMQLIGNELVANGVKTGIRFQSFQPLKISFQGRVWEERPGKSLDTEYFEFVDLLSGKPRKAQRGFPFIERAYATAATEEMGTVLATSLPGKSFARANGEAIGSWVGLAVGTAGGAYAGYLLAAKILLAGSTLGVTAGVIGGALILGALISLVAFPASVAAGGAIGEAVGTAQDGSACDHYHLACDKKGVNSEISFQGRKVTNSCQEPLTSCTRTVWKEGQATPEENEKSELNSVEKDFAADLLSDCLERGPEKLQAEVIQACHAEFAKYAPAKPVSGKGADGSKKSDSTAK